MLYGCAEMHRDAKLSDSRRRPRPPCQLPRASCLLARPFESAFLRLSSTHKRTKTTAEYTHKVFKRQMKHCLSRPCGQETNGKNQVHDNLPPWQEEGSPQRGRKGLGNVFHRLTAVLTNAFTHLAIFLLNLPLFISQITQDRLPASPI